MFAAYNRWANELLYEAAADLPAHDYRRDCGAFFKSMHGTLSHILTGDRIWLNRFTGEGDAPDRLDAVPFDDFSDLRAARVAEDNRIINWVGSLDDDALESHFHYVPITDPTPVSQRLAPALSHFFNHQTHHRGQAHTILTVLGKDAPSLDLIYFQRSKDGKSFA